MITNLITALTIFGIATMYDDSHIGNPLYCDTYYNNLTYRDDLSFIAIPVEWYSDGWQCGDEVIIFWSDGTRLHSFSNDAGPFVDNCVIVGDECISIIADIPEHLFPFDGLSARASLLNVSKLNRILPSDVMVGYLRK